MATAKKPVKKEIAILYARVSTQMQVNDGMSLDAQERDLLRAAVAAGYKEKETSLVREEGRSGKSINGRPVLKASLEKLESGAANAMFVTRIDRLARSTRDFLYIVDHSEKFHWRLVLLDLNLDTSSYSSRFVVTIMSALAEMERGIIAERQKDVHRDRRENGKVWGVDLGLKTKVSPEVRSQISEYRSLGMSYGKIAEKLNDEKIPPTRGAKWYASTVHNLVNNLKDKGSI